MYSPKRLGEETKSRSSRTLDFRNIYTYDMALRMNRNEYCTIGIDEENCMLSLAIFQQFFVEDTATETPTLDGALRRQKKPQSPAWQESQGRQLTRRARELSAQDVHGAAQDKRAEERDRGDRHPRAQAHVSSTLRCQT